MRHELYASLDDLLVPENVPVSPGSRSSRCAACPSSGDTRLRAAGCSGCKTNGGDGPRFVVKQTSRVRDWVMRATADLRSPGGAGVDDGLLDERRRRSSIRFSPARGMGRGWAILMWDVSETLLPAWGPGSLIEVEDHALCA